MSAPTGSSVRLGRGRAGQANVATGVPVLDHLLGLLADRGSFELALEVAPGAAAGEVAAAGHALGAALADLLRADGAPGFAAATLPADEALAQVVLEASGRPLVVTNFDLTSVRLGGLASDLVARFLDELAVGASITLHVRLIGGDEPQHVLEAIFKALGVALAQACGPAV
jgi:imidazoleglycerol-phosphate dehydratase